MTKAAFAALADPALHAADHAPLVPATVLPLRPAAAMPATSPEATFSGTDPDIARTHFTAFQDHLQTELGKEVYDSWFRSLNLQEIKSTSLHVSVPTRFLKSWLMTHYADRMLTYWQRECPTTRNIEITVRTPTARAPAKSMPNTEPKHAVRASDKSNAPQREIASSPLDPKMSLANYVIGRSNKMAHGAAMLAASVDPLTRSQFNPLYIHGAVGMGKTHLLQAIAHNEAGRALYMTAECFLYSFLPTLKTQNGNGFDLKNSLRSIDLLLIDDLQFLQGKNTVTDLSHVLNTLIDSGSQVIVAADRQPSQLDGIDDRLRSRLSGGLSIEIHAPDEDTRRDILKLRAATIQKTVPNFVLDDAALDYLAKSLATSSRDLEGALNQLLAYAKLEEKTIDMAVVEATVTQFLQAQPPKRIRIEEIQRTTARFYNISRDDMISARRTARVVRPRQVAVYLAKTLTLRSLPEIGRRFGNRDHTTVLHAVRKIEALVAKDTVLAGEVEAIKRLLV